MTNKAAERIKHVVVLMLENRSFDHMLGTLPGVNGILDASGKPKAFFNLVDPTKSDSERFDVTLNAPFAVPTKDVPSNGYGGPSHSFPAATEQLFGAKVKPKSSQGLTPEVLNGFISSYSKTLEYSAHVKDPSKEESGLPLACFTAEQLPVISTLAQQFCVCDQWFSEVPGPTEPNRLFMHAATSEGFTHNVWDRPLDARTIYQNLHDAGHTWAVYYYDLADSNQFNWVRKQIDNIRTFDTFFKQVAGDDLPTYSFLCPRYVNTSQERANSEHAPEDVRYGEYLIADVYEALRASKNWESTLFILLFDEHGGFYDHVEPPAKGVQAPDEYRSPTDYDKAQAKKSDRDKYLLDPDYEFDFKRLGLRVPCLLISPWIRKGSVCSDQLQHTSVLATLKQLYGLPNFLTRRDAQAKTFSHLLEELDSPRTDTPQVLQRPDLPGKAEQTWLRERTSKSKSTKEPPDASETAPWMRQVTEPQREMAKTLCHLEGHGDSGCKDVELPSTQGALAEYIRERMDAHRAHVRLHRDDSNEVGAFEIYEDKAKEYRWRLKDAHGENVASSGEGFRTLSECRTNVALVRALSSQARLDEPHRRRH